MQENQTVGGRVKCEILTPETRFARSECGALRIGVLERRHLAEGRGRAEGQAATAGSSQPSTINDQGLKCIPWHPRHLERTVFEGILLGHHQLKLRCLLIMC